MEEEVKVTEEKNEYQKYLDSIEKLKSETVSREKYDKLQEENKILLESIVNGQKIAAAESDESESISKDELVKIMLKQDVRPTEYVEAALKFRDIVIAEGGKDPFVASGHYIQPSIEANASAERTAEVLRQCLQDCDGNSEVLIQKLQNRINDVRLPGVKY